MKKMKKVLQIIPSLLIFLRHISCELNNCGGDFTGHQYSIESPNYPENYPLNKNCDYILRGSESANCSQEFHLQFIDFQIEASKGCGKDYLRIGSSNIYCGNGSGIGIRKFESSENRTLKLTFNSDATSTAKGFKILVTTLPCQASKNEKSAFFSLPEFRPTENDDETKSGVEKKPSENLELPDYQGSHFHTENCGHARDEIGSITSYLYLPPVPKTNFQNPEEILIKNINQKIIPRPPSAPQISQGAKKSPELIRNREILSNFYDENNRWKIYGVPNQNPSIPSENFDPFENGNGNNPGSQNCANNNNNYNPAGEDLSPGIIPSYPGTGFGNNNNNNDNFGANFGATGSQNPGFFWSNGYYYPNNNNNNYNPVDTSYYDTGVSQCCGTTYSGSNYLLSSRGFPALIYSSENYDCQYMIKRSSERVCNLEMNLKFFNFGTEDEFCAYGYVEIDGNRICGCKTGANLTSSFDNISSKIINVKYLGYPRNKFSGFVIEVTEVFCSTGYFRVGNNNRAFQFPVNYYPRIYKSDETESRSGRELAGNFHRRRISGNFQLPNTCRILKFFNWVKASKLVYLRNAQCSGYTRGTANPASSAISVIPIFPETGNSALINFQSGANCEIVNVIEGTISSPNYPNSYSNNVNICYRFYKAPGYCQLELAIIDFDLEDSTFCRKDYVAFIGHKRRYCGTSLSGSRTIFDMTQSTFADLYFVTDSSVTGRGFRAGFSQISC